MKHIKTIYFALITLFTITCSNTIQTAERKGDAWRKKIFDYIYEESYWASEKETPLSGKGSSLEATSTLRVLLPAILEAINAKTMLDAGCGDFTWMQKTPLPVETYIGIDIAAFVIEENQKKYQDETHTFYLADIVKDLLPKVDVILCRDCLAHLSNEDLIAAVKNFKKSGSKYLLTSTYPRVKVNTNIFSGHFRGMNLRAYPFNFPVPIILFEEISAEKSMKTLGKFMALWRLEDIEL